MDVNDRNNERDDAHSRPCRGIPANMLVGLVAYRDESLPVGDFLYAVLMNDLSEAACRVDAMNLPASAYGSKNSVKAWPEMKETEYDV